MSILRVLFTVFEALLALNLLIFVHELGHFLAARWRGMKVERFAIWFGKPIWSKKINDVEYALGEREFIYSLNRLNVAVTRGRAKAIVFLPRPLLEPPIQALDHPAAAEGIAFMQGLARWAELGAVAATTAAGASLTVLRRS